MTGTLQQLIKGQFLPFVAASKLQAVKTYFKITLLKLFLVASLALRDRCHSTVFINSKWSAVKWQEIQCIFESQDGKTRKDRRDCAIALADGEWYTKKGCNFSKVSQLRRGHKSKWSQQSALVTFPLYLCSFLDQYFFQTIKVVPLMLHP